jgi:Glycosyl transferase family 2
MGSEGVSEVARLGSARDERPGPVEDGCENVALGVTVVICAHTELRWGKTRAAVESVFGQLPRPAEVMLVVDHNPELAARARRELAQALVIENDGAPGLSDTRNAGLRAATQPITAFLDDDAEARPGWLASLVEPYSHSDVVATGGSVYPWWSGDRPSWLPPTFDWVVGCSYLGLPDSVGPVRNPIGANMSLRTNLALEVGGFDAAMGRVGSRPRGCEETELAIRLTASRPRSVVLYVPTAAVDHHVGKERLKISYFLQRCWHEGLSKATVVRRVGSSAGLERERRHVTVVIPAALLRDLRRFAAGESDAFMRMSAAILGLATTTAGYLTGRASHPRRSRVRNRTVSRRGSPGSWPSI